MQVACKHLKIMHAIIAAGCMIPQLLAACCTPHVTNVFIEAAKIAIGIILCYKLGYPALYYIYYMWVWNKGAD
jgi:hypothetical protein